MSQVATAKEMGAKYACITAQHEGGFALWNSSYTNYSTVHSPYGKDKPLWVALLICCYPRRAGQTRNHSGAAHPCSI